MVKVTAKYIHLDIENEWALFRRRQSSLDNKANPGYLRWRCSRVSGQHCLAELTSKLGTIEQKSPLHYISQKSYRIGVGYESTTLINLA